MNWAFLLHPAAVYALTAAGLIACGYLFLSAKRDILRITRQSGKKQRTMEAEIRSLRETLGRIERRIEEIGDLSDLACAAPLADGLNISKRTQALRMHHRGEPVERIAAALVLPRQEVELLLKVESLARTFPAVSS